MLPSARSSHVFTQVLPTSLSVSLLWVHASSARSSYIITHMIPTSPLSPSVFFSSHIHVHAPRHWNSSQDFCLAISDHKDYAHKNSHPSQYPLLVWKTRTHLTTLLSVIHSIQQLSLFKRKLQPTGQGARSAYIASITILINRGECWIHNREATWSCCTSKPKLSVCATEERERERRGRQTEIQRYRKTEIQKENDVGFI